MYLTVCEKELIWNRIFCIIPEYLNNLIAQSDWAVEYTDCTSAQG